MSYIDDNKANAIAQLIESKIDREYGAAIRYAANESRQRPRQSSWIIKQDPYHNARSTERGIIMELIWDADIFKKANFAAGSIGMAMLGKYARQRLAQITIHTGALAENEMDNCSFTFFVTETLAKKLKLTKAAWSQ